jgi:hypothetical protein
MDNAVRERLYDKGYWAGVDMVLSVIAEMQESMNFHNPTLDELEQRIV